MQSTTCDNCGSGTRVRKAFVIVWNGNVFDLCWDCQKPLAEILDGLGPPGNL